MIAQHNSHSTPAALIARLTLLAACCLAFLGCGELENYPPGEPGWHTPDYSVVFGKLERVNAAGGTGQWILRYATVTTTDPYAGAFVLSPPQIFNCLAPGDQVEVIGKPVSSSQPNSKAKAAAGPGTLYNVQTVYYWLNSGHQSVLTH